MDLVKQKKATLNYVIQTEEGNEYVIPLTAIDTLAHTGYEREEIAELFAILKEKVDSYNATVEVSKPTPEDEFYSATYSQLASFIIYMIQKEPNIDLLKLKLEGIKEGYLILILNSFDKLDCNISELIDLDGEEHAYPTKGHI